MCVCVRAFVCVWNKCYKESHTTAIFSFYNGEHACQLIYCCG